MQEFNNENKTKQNKTKQNKQNKTKQNKTKQNKTKKNKESETLEHVVPRNKAENAVKCEQEQTKKDSFLEIT